MSAFKSTAPPAQVDISTLDEQHGANLDIGRHQFVQVQWVRSLISIGTLTYHRPVPISAFKMGASMRTLCLLSFFVLIAASLPAQAKELPEHTVLAFNLPACPKGWAEFTPAAGKVPGLIFCEKALGRR
jgi:hypothetical protein